MVREIKYINYNKEYSLEQHGNWIDLAVSKTYNLNVSVNLELLDLGIAMQLPKYYEALMIPRSSTFKKYNIIQANSVGLIDTNFNGSGDIWKFPAIAFKPTTIKKNSRICQFRIQLSMDAPWHIKLLNLFTKFKFVEVDMLENPNRGGFGQTGD